MLRCTFELRYLRRIHLGVDWQSLESRIDLWGHGEQNKLKGPMKDE
jgi:hypothetical protein